MPLSTRVAENQSELMLGAEKKTERPLNEVIQNAVRHSLFLHSFEWSGSFISNTCIVRFSKIDIFHITKSHNGSNCSYLMYYSFSCALMSLVTLI